MIVICEATADTNIYEACCDAVEVAQGLRRDVELVFQGVRLIVSTADTRAEVMERYHKHEEDQSSKSKSP